MPSTWHPTPGECLLIDSGPTGKHLFILVLEAKSGNQHQVLSVPVCTVREYARIDDACLIQEGEHSFVNSESFIEFRNARLDSVSHLLERVRERTFLPHDPASPELIRKIKDGLANSRYVKRYIKDLLDGE